jgi:FlgD Ig-like domain/Matrixin
MRKFAYLVIVLALFTLSLASASFAVVHKMEIRDLRDASSDIIVGRVMSYEAAWDGNLIYTYYKVKVLDRVKGNPADEITVRVPGGEVGEVILMVSDTPYLKSGEDAFLFLKQNGDVREVTGWYQGKYAIKEGKVEDTGLTVQQFKAGIAQGKPAKPPQGGGYKLCGYDWTYLGMSGGKYHQEPWAINPSNNDGMSSGSVNSAIQAAANTWTGAGACFNFGTGGSTNLSGAALDGNNVISFGNTGGAVAATYIWVLKSCRKCIAELDLVFDHVYWDFGVSVCGSTTKFDLQNVATHEFGHWLCLADLYGGSDVNQTMYGYVDYGECNKKDLYTGDIAGIKSIYGTCAALTASGTNREVELGEAVGGMTVQFAVPAAGPATVQVYNVMGQTVATLADGYLEAGQHSLAWDGRDTNGNRVASGVYFVLVRGADYARSSKIMVVK